jgi:hypothetical protein
VGVRRWLLSCLAAASVAIACGASPDRATKVVESYLHALGRDPLRTLPLVTDAFHRRHGLHAATAAEARGERETATSFGIDRYQHGWLAMQSRPEIARRLAETTISFDSGNLGEDGDRAAVTVSIAPRDAPAFEQRFTLVRDGPGAPWRIDAVEQIGVTVENARTAFAAYPNEAARRALAESRGR